MKSTRIQEHMIRYPFTVSPEQSLTEAAEMLKDSDIRHLPVVQSGRLVGIVSERDLREALAVEGSQALAIGDIMNRDVFIVEQTTPLAAVAEEMAESKIGSTIVVNGLRQVIGIFTTTDALRLLAKALDDQSMEELLLDLNADGYEDVEWAAREALG